MKQIARLVVGFSLGLVLLTGCVPFPFFGPGPGPEHHEDHGRGPDDGPHHEEFHGDHGRDFR